MTAPLAASVAPNRPGWRRHVPLLAFLAALAVLVVALADPRTTHAESIPNSAIMLACDVSGSMGVDRRVADAAAGRGARRTALPRSGSRRTSRSG